MTDTEFREMLARFMHDASTHDQAEKKEEEK